MNVMSFLNTIAYHLILLCTFRRKSPATSPRSRELYFFEGDTAPEMQLGRMENVCTSTFITLVRELFIFTSSILDLLEFTLDTVHQFFHLCKFVVVLQTLRVEQST